MLPHGTSQHLPVDEDYPGVVGVGQYQVGGQVSLPWLLLCGLVVVMILTLAYVVACK